MNSDPAKILAFLILNGLALEPTENLPLEWRPVYDAVRSAHGAYLERCNALEASLVDDPYGLLMQAEIEEAIAADTTHIGQFRIYSAWETVTEPPAPTWAVKGLLSRPSLNLLVGAPGSKKTWLAFDLAVCVASGRSWLGFECDPTPVLIIDEEGGLPRTWDRLHRIMAGRQVPQHIPLYFTSMAGHSFRLHDEEEFLASRANHLKVGLIIFDALANFMSGLDENNKLSVQPIFEKLNKLARLANAAVVVIHHTNKHGIFRGSTLMASGADHMLAVESPPQNNLIHLHTLKARDLEPIDLNARAHFEDSRFWLTQEDVQPVEIELKPVARSILRFLAVHPGSTTPDLMRSIEGKSPSTIRQAVHELTVAGYITRIDGGTRGQVAAFQISEKGGDLIKDEKP